MGQAEQTERRERVGHTSTGEPGDVLGMANLARALRGLRTARGSQRTNLALVQGLLCQAGLAGMHSNRPEPGPRQSTSKAKVGLQLRIKRSRITCSRG